MHIFYRIGIQVPASHITIDHYQGITTTWQHGNIYCSRITKKLLLKKYPKLKEIVIELSYFSFSKISVNGKEIKIKIYDSNHMAGSVMFLIHFEDRYYFHTGDMRFNENVAKNNPDLFAIAQDGTYRMQY